MPNLHDYHDEDIVNAETHHEKSDVNVRALLAFGVVFVIFAAVSHFVLFVIYKQFVKYENRNQHVPLTMMERPESMSVPQIPRLQPFPTKSTSGVIAPNANTPVTDMAEMRAAQDQELNTYGYIDRQKGVLHIPIEEAKKLALQRGFAPMSAAAPAPPPATATGNQQPATTTTATSP
jgi:hypothetical protein